VLLSLFVRLHLQTRIKKAQVTQR